jgi:hypothetical protein
MTNKQWIQGALVAAALALPWAAITSTQGRNGNVVAIDPDDIGGIVTSTKGPEAGVWVIAETKDLQTKFIKIVVTDDQGRYVLPDLPRATYQVWVRGYGLVDSKPVTAKLGQHVNLTAVVAPSAKEAAAIYPANYWLALLRPGDGPIAKTEMVRRLKTCMACHQIGDKSTREMPPEIGPVTSHLDAWDTRVKTVPPQGASMIGMLSQMGPQRAMLADWTERIAKGEYPMEAPARPSGMERNLVISMWDWGTSSSYAHDEAATDKRDIRRNAGGRVWGPSQFHDTLMWVDPNEGKAGEIPIPTTAPLSSGGKSLHFGEDILWKASVEPRSAAIDEKGRVWIAAKYRTTEQQPAFCKEGSSNKFAKYFPMNRGGKQVSFYDPKTQQFTSVDTCFTADHNDIGEDGKIYFGQNGSVGYIDTKMVDAKGPVAANSEAAQGWCPGILDTNGDGTITPGWTEPNEPVDPKKDHRIQFGCYQLGIAPDGAIWCGPGGETDNRIVRLEFGKNAPQSCKAEVYQVPTGVDVSGSRGLDVDGQGVAWVNMSATDHMASFDRRKCKVLNGPTATGQQCPEGWTFYPIPGPKFQGVDRPADMLYLTTVDRNDVFNLAGGKDVPITELGNSDSLMAVLPGGKFFRMRVPYPLGFFGRSNHARIDDPKTGWKGRAIWSSYAGYAAWHVEGGKGEKAKVVKFQLRPDPLAK